MENDNVLQIFQRIIKEPTNEYIDKWKDEGGKVIGYYCSYIPEEILTAAGILPIRIRGGGSHDTSLADVYVSAMLCTFMRHTVNLALEGKYGFLDGIIGLNTCDHVRRAYDVWKAKVNIPFKTFLSVPRTPEERVFDWYKEELENLKAGIEEHFSVRITEDKLKEAIKLHNETRRKLIRLCELRKSDNPPLTGTEFLTITVACHLMPKEKVNWMLDELFAEIGERRIDGNYRARLIMAGGELDEPEYLSNIEEQGGLSVAEDVCFGARYFSDLVKEEGDPMENIARRYFFHIPCARMVGGFSQRVEFLKQMFNDFKADGIVFQQIKFCQPWEGEAHNLRWRLKKEGIPVLMLEREYHGLAAGQVKTRVQAFLEQLGK